MCVYFVDRSLGRRAVADPLREAGERVEVHDAHFDQGCPDPEWLAEAGRRGWIVLTKDERIGRRRMERVAVADSNVRMFVLASAGLAGEQMAAAFVHALPAIQSFAAEHDPPFIAKVYRDGTVRAWKSGDELRG